MGYSSQIHDISACRGPFDDAPYRTRRLAQMTCGGEILPPCQLDLTVYIAYVRQ